LYGIPLLNAKKQFYEHFCANSIDCNTRANHIRYTLLLLFGDEKTKSRRKLIWIPYHSNLPYSKKLDLIELFLCVLARQLRTHAPNTAEIRIE
jgi:hypothetical protein